MRETFLRGYRSGHIVERLRVRRGWSQSFRVSAWLFDREDAYHSRSRSDAAMYFLGHMVGDTVAVTCGMLHAIRDAHKLPDHITIWVDKDTRHK